MGDSRVYGYIIILRAVKSLDMMSAEPFEFNWSLLRAISRRIVNEVDGVSRVVYDTTEKPPGQMNSLACLDLRNDANKSQQAPSSWSERLLGLTDRLISRRWLGLQ